MKAVKIFSLILFVALFATHAWAQAYKYSFPQYSQTTNGGGTWGSILNMTVWINSNNTITARVVKQDGSAFKAGYVYLQKESPGASSAYNLAGARYSGGYTYTLTSNQTLDDIDSGWNYNVLRVYLRTEYDDGGYAWVGPISIRRTELQPFPAPSLVSPAAESKNISLTPFLDWSSISGASTYRVMVSTSSSFNTDPDGYDCYNCVINYKTGATSSYRVQSGELEYDTRYYWQVRAGSDSPSIGGYWSATHSFTTASAPVNRIPSVVISSPSSGYETTEDSVLVKGTASDPDGRVDVVRIRKDNGSWMIAGNGTAWSRTIDLTLGTQTIYVRAQDEDGAYSDMESITVTRNQVVQHAPEVFIDTPISGSSTMASSVDVTGLASDEDGSISVVRIRVNGGSWYNVSGVTRWTATAALAIGQNTIEAIAKDDEGIYSERTSVTVTREMEVQHAPAVTIRGPLSGSMFSAPNVGVYGSASDPDGDIEIVQIRSNNGSWREAAGTAEWSGYVPLRLGSNLIEARVRDASGLYSSIQSVIVTREETVLPPTITISNPSSGDGTPAESVLVQGSSSDPDGTVRYVQIRVNGSPWEMATGTSSWSYTIPLTLGENLIEARAFDNSDKYALTSLTVTRTPTVQPEPPRVTITQPVSGEETTAESIGIKGTATDPDGSITRIEMCINNETWQPLIGLDSWAFTAALNLGQNSIDVRARDNDGQYSDVQSLVVTRNEVVSLLNAAKLVDENYPDNTIIQEGRAFTKTWTIENTGTTTWNSTYGLHYASGALSVNQTAIAVQGTVSPGETYTFQVPMRAPESQESQKTYRDDWQFKTPTGSTIAVGASQTLYAQVVVAGTQSVDDGQCARSADPYNKWTDPGWVEGPEAIQLPELREGKASHSWSPAELIYYSAKENDINPVLLLAKLQDEQSLLTQGESYGDTDFEWRLTRATGYGALDGGDVTNWYGFYPQLVSSSYEWHTNRTQSLSFRKAYEDYTTGDGKYDGFVASCDNAGIYACVARNLNAVAGTSYAEQPESSGYYNDFKDVVTAEHIQTLLHTYYSSGALGNENLFQEVPTSSSVNYCQNSEPQPPQPTDGSWLPSADGFDYPVKGYFHPTEGWHIESTRDFAWVNDQYVQNKYHLGEDWNYKFGDADEDEPVYVIANGRVVSTDYPGDAWKGIIIVEHYVPGTEERFTTMYAHLNPDKINDWVREGDWVYRGQQIGIIGPKPSTSTAPHLHFEMRTWLDYSNGPGYSANNDGWRKPSTYIDSHRFDSETPTSEMERLKGMGILADSNETYRPNHYESRAEYLKMIMEVIKRNAPAKYEMLAATPTDMPGDVETDAWYYDYIARAINADIIGGGKDFRPNDRILRAEVAKMSVQTMQFVYGIDVEQKEYLHFVDIDAGQWYFPYVQTGVKYNLWHGVGENFYPVRWLPRKWSAAIIAKILDYKPTKPIIELLSGVIQEGQTIRKSVSLFNFQPLITAEVEWPGSDLDLRITTPSGRVLDPNSDIVVEFYEGPVKDYYIINSDEEGVWQFDIIGEEVDPDGEPYWFTVTTGEKQEEAVPVDCSFVNPSFSMFDGDSDGFSETLRLNSGLVSLCHPENDRIFSDSGYEIVTFADLLLDPTSYVSGSVYDFAQTTYADGFALYDDDNTFLLGADLSVSSLNVDGGTGAINPGFNVNLTNITAPEYILGTSEIIDAILAAGAGALNLTPQFAGDNLGWLIEGGEDVFGTASGSFGTAPVPEPGTLLLLGGGLLAVLGLVRKRRHSKK